ncbi:MAG: polysaccharide deacetylase family protein [Herpetosiphon sp.]
MRARIRRLQRRRTITFLIVISMLLFAFQLWQSRHGSALSLAGPNLVPNPDFAKIAPNGVPEGWSSAFGDGKGIQRGSFTVTPGSGYSLFLSGANNWVRSPYIAVHSGDGYRVSLMALSDNQETKSETSVEVWFHWRDDRGTDFSIEYSDAQTVPFGKWVNVVAARQAPPRAVQLAVSIHPRTDDRIVVDQFRLSQLGVHVEAWPQGKQAAVAFSFDYETAMGGLVHSRSEDDPNSGVDPQQRAARMRTGADVLLDMFRSQGVRGTFYTTGYNFLTGNREGHLFMENPTYKWATKEHRWSTDFWSTHPWFALDPHGDEQSDPGWYFGSQVARLKEAGQAIQSHTFAHFAGSYVKPADWRADFAAWKAAAHGQGIAPATSLAFPWSSSAGMSEANWKVLVEQGIRSVTRTNWSQPRFGIADRTTYALRPLAAHPGVTVIGDEYVQPAHLERLKSRLNSAMENGGAIDLWAHTEEVVTPVQQQTWQALIDAARTTAWIATVPDIIDYHQAVREVTIQVRSERPTYVFDVTNGSNLSLQGLTLTVPVAAQRITIDKKEVTANGSQVQVDLAAHQSVEIRIWPA